MEEIKKMNIFEKMSNITNEIEKISKNLTVGEGKSSYKAVGEADVLKAVRELEYKYRVYSYPCYREILESTMYTTSNNYGEKNNIFSRIKTVYRFVNIDKTDDFIETTTFAEGIDSQDKGSGKAMTYADKYALMKAYKIITGDDPDQSKSKDEKKIDNNVKKENSLIFKANLTDIDKPMNFGKYKDKTWIQVYTQDIGYLEELVKNCKSEKGKGVYTSLINKTADSFISVKD